MRTLSISMPKQLGKFTIIAALGFGACAWSLSPTPAEAQMPEIVLQ